MNGEGIDIYGTSAAARKIRDIATDIKMHGFSKTKPFAMGRIEHRMAEYAKRNNITLAGKSIYISSHSISHTLRDSKIRDGKAVSLSDLINFPKGRAKMDLFFDGDSFVYTNYKVKFIIHPNYEIKINRKKTMKANYITATKVTDANEFKLGKYKKV